MCERLGIKPKKRLLSKQQNLQLRAYNCKKKRESRKKLSEKGRQQVKDYDNERKAQNIKEQQEVKVKIYMPLTKASLWQATHRAMVAMPNCPNSHIKVLCSLFSKAVKSPRKLRIIAEEEPPVKMMKMGVRARKKLDMGTEKAITLKREGKKTLKTLKWFKKKKDLDKHREMVQHLKKKYTSLMEASRRVGIRWRALNAACSIPEDWEDLEDFYLSSDVAIDLPDKAYAGKKFLTKTIQSAYRTYIGMACSKTSMTKFQRLRPKRVKCRGRIPDRECVCETCANLLLTLKSMCTYGLKVEQDVSNMSDATL